MQGIPPGKAHNIVVRPDWVLQIVREADEFVRSLADSKPDSARLERFFRSLPPPACDLERRILSDVRDRLARMHGPAARRPPAERARQLLVDQYRKPWTLVGLARAVGSNRTTLQEQFHSLTGTTMHRFLVQRRIAVAARLLGHSDVKVSRVSEEVGYRSHSAFVRHFRKLTSVTPAAYRTLRRDR